VPRGVQHTDANVKAEGLPGMRCRLGDLFQRGKYYVRAVRFCRL
jgi:hypothetical protein